MALMNTHATTVTSGNCEASRSRCCGRVTSRFRTICKSTTARRPRPPANSAIPQTSSERGLARLFVRRASAVERGQPAPRTYRQYSHTYRAVGGTAHGMADQCLEFADTRTAHGVVPAVAATRPVRTARTTTGRRRHRASTVASRSLHPFIGRGAVDRGKRYVVQPEIHGELAPMMDEVTDVGPHDRATRGGEEDSSAALQ